MNFMIKITKIALSSLALVGVAIPSIANATNFIPGQRVVPCSDPLNTRSCRLPGPWEVPGKEYSNRIDVDDVQPIPNLDPGQILAWDGIGGRNNSFDYSGSRAGDTVDRNVDSLANNADVLFADVVNDSTWLLFSTQTDNRIWYENPGWGVGPVAGAGVWANAPTIDIDMATIDPNPGIQNTTPTDMDIDGLEVWGADGPGNDDSDRYSVDGDSFGDVSIWSYDAGTNTSTPFVTRTQIQNAIASLFSSANISTSSIDVDGLMVNGNEILFSIAPIDLDGGGVTNNAGDIDGGEIFYWSGVNGQPASFLFHGGHLWDTAFEVQNTYNTPSENINALEAVATTPEPAGLMGLLTVGGLGLLSYRKKQN